jgi:hypothetical protein
LTHLIPWPLIHRLEEVPLEVLRQRESKWLDMLNNWDKWMAKKHKKVRDLALGLRLGVNSLGGEGRR